MPPAKACKDDAASPSGDARRLRALLLIAAYAAFCGLPVWWRATSVPRPPLPHARMRALGDLLDAADPLPVRLDVRIVVADEGSRYNDAELAREVERRVREGAAGRLDVAVGVCARAGGGGGAPPSSSSSSSSSSSPSPSSSLPCPSPEVGARLLMDDLEPADADDLLFEALGPLEAGRYALVVALRGRAAAATATQTPAQPPPPSQPVLTIGKRRHAWAALPGRDLRSAANDSLDSVAASVAEAAALAVRHAFGLWAAPRAGGGGGGDQVPAELAALPLFSPGGLVLSFSLVNGDPPRPPAGAVSFPSNASRCAGGYAWDFSALEGRLAPLIGVLRQAAGGGAATVGAESAVLQLSPAGAEGAWRDFVAEEKEEEEEEENEAEEEEEEGGDEEQGDGASETRPQGKRRRRQDDGKKGPGAYVLSREQLPSFVDSEWPFESGRGVLSSAATMQRAAARRRWRRGGGGGGGRTGARARGREGGGGDDDDDQHAEEEEAEEWALERDCSAALLAPHVLHFVTYVPPPNQRPLLVEGAAQAAAAAAAAAANKQQQNSSSGGASSARALDPAANGYWIPSWGGVFIWNPDDTQSQEATAPGSAGASSSPRPPRVCALPDDASAAAARAFATHLRALLGLPRHGTQHLGSSSPHIRALRLLPSPERGLADWEADALARARVRVGAASAARTLRGLSEVVSELPNLGMPPLIGAQVGAALAAADAALLASVEGDYGRAAVAAAAASSAADAAYLNPSVLSQLNFPDSHKLGVYMPYFLPASVPLFQGLVREAKRWARRRRRRRREAPGAVGAAAAAAAAAAGAAGAAQAAAAAASGGVAGGGAGSKNAPAQKRSSRTKRSE